MHCETLIVLLDSFLLSFDESAKSEYHHISFHPESYLPSLQVGLCCPGVGEDSTLEPTNPYSAAKAGAEMIAKAYLTSYKLPVITTRGNNVYGPNQFPEKSIPKFTLLAARGEDLPVHGDGMLPSLPCQLLGQAVTCIFTLFRWIWCHILKTQPMATEATLHSRHACMLREIWHGRAGDEVISVHR